MEGWSEREEQIWTDLVNIPRDTPVPPLCSSSSPPTPFLRSHQDLGGPAGTDHRGKGGGWCPWIEKRHQSAAHPTSHSSDNDTRRLYGGPINKNPDNSLSPVRPGLHFSPFMSDCPVLFPRSHLAWPSSQILSILSEKISLYWSRPVRAEIINADPNCANSSSSIALITRLFTEALKKPLNCHSQQLKNIYRDKDWEKGI